MGIRQDDISVIPNCSDTDLFRVDCAIGDRFLDQHPHLRNKKIIAYAGTLGFANGVDYIIQLAVRMKSRDSEICFVIAGDGAKRDELTALANKLGVLGKNFWMLAPLPKNQVPPLLSAATAVCSTFILEAAPWPNSANKFFDGLAAGKPIVINYLGWQKDVLDRSGAGIALSPDNLDKAADKLKCFLDDDVAIAKSSLASSLLADTRYNRAHLAGKLRRVLEEAAAPPHHCKFSPTPYERPLYEAPLSQPHIKRALPSQQKR